MERQQVEQLEEWQNDRESFQSFLQKKKNKTNKIKPQNKKQLSCSKNVIVLLQSKEAIESHSQDLVEF